MKYICNDIFMLRTPGLPANVFSKFLNIEDGSIEDFVQKNDLGSFVDTSVLVSSRELYKAKDRILQHGTKKSKAREASLIKYLTRASTRPTPYGFFAGVALGEFRRDVNPEKLVIDEEKTVIECRVDHSWLSHFTYELENNPVVCAQLQVRFNNNCYVSGDRLKNPHYSNHGFIASKSDVVKRNHVRNTPLITFIKQEAQSFIDYNELKSKLQNRYPDVPEEKIISTINMLMDNEILFTNLRVPSNCVNGLEYILKVLEPIEGIERQKGDLWKVNELINQISNEHRMDGIDKAAIQEIYALLEGLLEQGSEKDLLAVNKGIVLRENKLPYELKATIEKFIEGITCLQVDAPSRLEKFKQQFQEEYGSHVEVPLCDIIDQNNFNGLSYLDINQPFRSEKDQKIKQIVDEKILYCLQSQGEEITLCQDDFSSLGEIKEDQLPESFDINFFVTKEDHYYHLSVAPIGGSGVAGDMFNRFGHVLDADLFARYRENNNRVVVPDSEVIDVEIREGSTRGRLSNINDHSSDHQYYIAIATNDDHSEATELSLDDLLIGMTNDRLYIKSRSQGKRCRVRHNCMVNPNVLSDVTRFLLYVTSDNERGIVSRIYDLFQNKYVFVPRILFEGVVIHPRSWNLPSHLFELSTLQSFAESFQILRHKYSIDDIVYLTESDNRLMLNLDKDYAVEILYKHIRRSKALQLDELERNVLTNGICLGTTGRSYVSEISCSLVRSADRESGLKLDDQLERILQNENRPMMLLQDGWIYAKLYHMDDRENEVLNYISYSLNSIGDPKFFYLRYSDDIGRHLRVRFKYPDESIAQIYFLALQKMLMSFQEHRLINKVQFDIYFRENNRYGGNKLIEFAENVFFADSRFVIGLLNEFNVEEADGLERAYLLGIITVLTAFFDCLEDMFNQVNQVQILDENKKEFRRKKQAYIKQVERLLSRDYSDLTEQITLLIVERAKAIQRYRDRVLEIEQLTNYRENIISSVIHMFCNRLKGDRGLEQKYLNIVREALSNIIEKRKRL